jgi:hypothetical protein
MDGVHGSVARFWWTGTQYRYLVRLDDATVLDQVREVHLRPIDDEASVADEILLAAALDSLERDRMRRMT